MSETQWQSSSPLETLQSSLDSLSNKVKGLNNKPNFSNGRSKMSFNTGRQPNKFRHGNNGRPNRKHQNNPPPYGSQRQANRSDASRLNRQQYQTARNFNDRMNNFGQRDRQNNRGNAGYTLRNETDQAVTNQGNWNKSGWRATTRHH